MHGAPRGSEAGEPVRPLEGAVAVVTGASRGIGAASARALATAGARVVLGARDAEALTRVATEIAGDGGEALAVPTDVTDEASVAGLIEEAVVTYGRLDLAFNNAGEGHRPRPLAELSLADLEHALAVHVRGVFLCMQHELRAMLPAGRGAIVNMSSTAGLGGVPGMAAYAAAKHAVAGLTRSAALDYAAAGIRVNAVAPGPILTDDLAAAGTEQIDRVGAYVPLGRVGRPEEVADAVVWLLSSQSSFLTGAVVPVDGGKLASTA